MLKALVILVAIFIAVVNVSAQSNGARRRVVRKAGFVRVGPSTTFLKQGLSTEEVVKLLGEPTAISELNESNGTVTYEFPSRLLKKSSSEVLSSLCVISVSSVPLW